MKKGAIKLGKVIRNFFILILITANLFSQQKNSPQLTCDIKKGEASIWYLFHSGWAVRTQKHFLIFDYWENFTEGATLTLENGFINPKEIADQNVIVFISHAHTDHYDPVILSWKDKIPNITYVWGWPEETESKKYYFDSARKVINIGDLKVYNIHHEFDGIPESAFLINVDGLWIFHAGDHGHSKGESNEIFKNNIEYLASLYDELDIMFTPTFGGESYAIQRLSPHIVFPMHDGGHENQYYKFAQKVNSRGFEVKVGVAKERGDNFFYKR
jgi:L-ascorbate metabolism protein UlaG (beta-lactamase superfamily)